MENGKLFNILNHMRNGRPVAVFNLLSLGMMGYTKEEIDWLEEQGYIYKSGKTELGEQQYSITDKGNERRKGKFE